MQKLAGGYAQTFRKPRSGDFSPAAGAIDVAGAAAENVGATLAALVWLNAEAAPEEAPKEPNADQVPDDVGSPNGDAAEVLDWPNGVAADAAGSPNGVAIADEPNAGVAVKDPKGGGTAVTLS
ncbi:hypothetical protein HDU90_007751 [Geranomyces variabilis]|nr:hypothetical protein HDU90_007751 [Geranomyces variabilis]